MANHYKKKLDDFFDLLLSIVLHAILLSSIAIIGRLVKMVLKLMDEEKFNDSFALKRIYIISDYVLIILFFVFVVFDIIKLIIRNIKQLKSD